MPPLARWFVRASLLYLVAGFTLGASMLILKAVADYGAMARLLAPHVEFVLVGWTVQLTMGVAFWILPRFEGGTSRGPEGYAVAALVLVNLGTLTAALSPPFGAPPVLALCGRVAELAGALSFGVHAWLRVKPFGA